MVCTTLYTRFMELSLKWKKPLGDVFIQMDNTVSENKNNHIMGFLAALIARGVMRSVTLFFMMVGHTHIKIDQVFSWWVLRLDVSGTIIHGTQLLPCGYNK